MEKWLDILSQCPIFRRLSAGEIADVFEHVPWRTDTFDKGAILFRAGETATKIGIILSGCLEMRKCLSTGNAVSLFQRRSGEMVGGGIVFSSRPEYPCDVIAREKSLVLWIDREAMLTLFLKNAVIASNMLQISADRIMQFEKRVELFSFYSIQKKIAFSLLNDFSWEEGQNVVIPFSKTTWAEYLNVSRTSLSRELKLLCEQRIIQMNGSAIAILQRDLLEAILY